MARINFLDFITASPNAFIFHKKKNKTNFGGFLFTLYILIMAFITITYIYDYSINDKYIVDALTHINTTYIEKDKSLDEDDNLNPYVDFNVTISGDADVDGQFVLRTEFYDSVKTEDYNVKHTSIFNLHKMIVDHLSFTVLYDCGKDKKCSTYDEDIDPNSFFTVSINYTGYKFYHWDDLPLVITEDIPKTFSFEIGFLDTIYEYLFLYWDAIIYKDQKTFLDTFTKKNREYIYGEIKNSKSVLDPGGSKKDFIYQDDTTKHYYMPLVDVYLLNEHKEYIEYKRIKLQFLDVVANIGALFSTLRFIFSSILSFYSYNFSNYQMVESLLKNPKIELNDKNNKANTSDKKEIIQKIDNLPLLDDDVSDENKYSINNQHDNDDNIISENENNNESPPPIALKKLSIFDFYFNNIYPKCCKKIKNQEILNLTNEIVLQYLSLDYILYNQIKLGNLFRDDRWNNPTLSNIQNNDLIMKLINISNGNNLT